MTYEKAIRKIKEFGLHHAIEDLPYSSYTVQAFEMAIKALEKQIPKKPLNYHGYDYPKYVCPNCNKKAYFSHAPYSVQYCPECGQAIDWSDNE